MEKEGENYIISENKESSESSSSVEVRKGRYVYTKIRESTTKEKKEKNFLSIALAVSFSNVSHQILVPVEISAKAFVPRAPLRGESLKAHLMQMGVD